jgi:hypothetical protein
MPQQWREHWPLDGDDEESRDAKVHLLGNLTLTSGPLNSSLSNATWATKRPALAQHSLLLLNQQVTTYEAWTSATIDARGRQLSATVCRLWPRPELPSQEAPKDEAPVEAVANSTPADAARETRRWSALDRTELRRFALELARTALERRGYVVAGPFDERSNVLTADRGDTSLEVHVRTSRNFNYTFLTKINFPLAEDRAVFLVVLVEEEAPRLYLIPAKSWESPDGFLVDREYDDLTSEPEWGINLSRGGLDSLARFAVEAEIGSVDDETGRAHGHDGPSAEVSA